jgi:hypothetical protein
MATARIDQLTDATTVALADELPIIQGGVTKRATVGEVKTALNIGANDYGTVANEAAMVALSAATPGSTCYRSDTTSIWMLKVAPYSSAGNWHNLSAATGVQNGLTPASTTLAPCVDAVNAALNPAVRSESASFTITKSVHANRVTHCTSGSATNATWNIDATMVAGDYGRIIQTGSGAVTIVVGTGAVLYAPRVGTPPIATTGDGDWIDWECTGTNEITITDSGKAISAGSGNMATDAIWDAKGDLAAGSGANTAIKLSVGADGTILTASSAAASGMAWASPGAATFVVIALPSGSTIGASQSDATLSSLTIPANTWTTGKMIEITAFINHTATDDTSFSITYGGTTLATYTPGAYGSNSMAILKWVGWAISNSSQVSINNTGDPNYKDLHNFTSKTSKNAAAVDATSNQTLLLRCTTGAGGTTAIQCIGGKVVVV